MTLHISRRRLITGSAAAAASLALWRAESSAVLARIARLHDAPVAIHHWHRHSGAPAAEWEKLAAQFNEAMTGKVVVTTVAQGTIQEHNQKMRAAAAGGALPGASMADDADVTQYAANGIIVDIEPFLDDAETG